MNVWGDSKSSSPLFVEGLNEGPKVINSSIKVRMAYLRKVYTILSVQLALTTLISIAIMLMPAMLEFVIRK
jgi:FtsH-binding integral membrane protein